MLFVVRSAGLAGLVAASQKMKGHAEEKALGISIYIEALRRCSKRNKRQILFTPAAAEYRASARAYLRS